LVIALLASFVMFHFSWCRQLSSGYATRNIDHDAPRATCTHARTRSIGKKQAVPTTSFHCEDVKNNPRLQSLAMANSCGVGS
jgi:hypothetical protein